MAKLLLIDASPYIFRAFYSMPETMVDTQGNPCNAVYGFTNFLFQIINQARPEYIAIAFDDKLSTSFRNELYPAYKQNRETPPESLVVQFPACFKIAEEMGLPVYIDKAYEADDLVGSLVAKFRDEGLEIWIATSDKDMTQLIADGDIFWDFARDRKLDPTGIYEHFGVHPHQIVDYLALTGDQSDNIPGVAGIGPKSAVALLENFQTLENLYENLDAVSQIKIRGAKSMKTKLEKCRDKAFLSQKLARIMTDKQLCLNISELACRPVRSQALDALFDFYGFGENLRTRIGYLEKI